MNEILHNFKEFLIRIKVFYIKPNLNYDEKKIIKQDREILFDEIVSIRQNTFLVSNYAFITFIIVGLITFFAALIYNIYTIENTYMVMNPGSLRALNALARLKGLTESDGISKVYEYDSWFLFFGPLFNSMFWGLPSMLIGFNIKRYIKQYEVLITNGETIYMTFTKKELMYLESIVDSRLNRSRDSLKYTEASYNKTDINFESMYKYKKLLDEGIISQEEFDKVKKDILDL